MPMRIICKPNSPRSSRKRKPGRRRRFLLVSQPEHESGGGNQQSDRECADRVRNPNHSLLITTNSQYFPTIENLLLELDKDIQQILIEVLIVEVSDVDDNELGIDWDGEIPLNVQADFNSTLSDITSERATILGRTEFNAVLNFLSYNNKTNVVARPNILTGDNQMAYIEAINRIPITKRISVSNEFVVPEVELEPVDSCSQFNPHQRCDNRPST